MCWVSYIMRVQYSPVVLDRITKPLELKIVLKSGQESLLQFLGGPVGIKICTQKGAS